jgi:hypothetical protein
VFRFPVDAKEFIENAHKPDYKILGFNYWHVRQAPDPKDIIWENKQSSMANGLGFRVILEVGFFILFLIFLTPTSMYYIIDDFFTSIGLAHFFRSFLAGYLPSLLPMLLHTVILPEAIALVVDLERHTTKSQALSSRLFKFLAFSLFYVLLVPMLGIGAVEIFSQILDNSTETWTVTFATKLMHAGHIFTLYMIHMALLGFGFELLQIPKVIKVYWRRWRALTVDEALKAYEADDLDQAQQFSMNVTLAGIILCFSVVYPLILVFGALYFILRLIGQKYNLLCFYYVELLGDSHAVPHMIVKGMFVYVFIFQLLNAGVLMLSANTLFISIGSALIFISFVSLGLFFCYFNQVLISKLIQESPSELMNPDPQAYKHPADWQSAVELSSED